MGRTKKYSAFKTFCSILPVEFQTFLNILGLVGVSAISYGLWTCLGELEKLREVNSNVASSVARFAERSELLHGSLDAQMSVDKSFQSHRLKRQAPKRGTNLPEFMFDSFSSVDRVSVIYFLILSLA